MYIYEGHLGSLYACEEELDYEDLYCEQCADSDWLIGYAEDRNVAWELLKDSGGWNYEYVMEFLDEYFGEIESNDR